MATALAMVITPVMAKTVLRVKSMIMVLVIVM